MNTRQHTNQKSPAIPRGGISRRARRVVVVGIGLVAITGLGGCDNAGHGLFSGAALGAVTGVALGSLSGNAGEGAVAGAIIGGAGGAILGDQNERNRNNARYGARYGNYSTRGSANRGSTSNSYYYYEDRSHGYYRGYRSGGHHSPRHHGYDRHGYGGHGSWWEDDWGH